MDTSDRFICFDESGNCNHCKSLLKKQALHHSLGKNSKKHLDELVAEIKKSGRGKEYDCVLGLSGGADSSYTGFLLKEMGLRVLVVHMDNGWNSEEAVQNIKQIVQKLGFDYVSYVLDWEEFKDLQLAFLKASIPEAETPTDIAIIAALHKVAAAYKIKYIISGGNYATEGILPGSWHYNAKDTRLINSIQKKFGRSRLKKFPLFGYKLELYYKLVKGIRILYILNHVPYNKNQANDLLVSKFDWQPYGGKHHESVFTRFIQSFYLKKKFNIDYRRATFSTMIVTGEMTREDAMLELQKPGYSEEQVQAEKAYISKKLGISLAELESIIDLPAKQYTDYPNDEKFLLKIYAAYHKIQSLKKKNKPPVAKVHEYDPVPSVPVL